jgi:BirA family biotin operon repressor/biotin-[acetyl-CoA-carboxylase] ligase
MIKNTTPEFEEMVLTGSAPATPQLQEFLDVLGLDFPQKDGQVLWNRDLELLDHNAVHSALEAQAAQGSERDLKVEIHRTVASTNDEVMKRLGEPGDPLIVCLAEMQTAGKGRRGRRWVSPFGRNIYLTIGYFHSGEAGELGGLSLIAGTKLVEVLRQCGLASAGLKWPNDVIVEGGKMAGILVELRPREERGVGVVLGVGINLHLSSGDAAQIDQAWSTAGEALGVSRSDLAISLAAELISGIEEFSREGFSPFAGQWQEYNLYAGQEVRIIRGNEAFAGIDRGVDENGNLLLETASGIQSHNAGEVSLRPVAR